MASAKAQPREGFAQKFIYHFAHLQDKDLVRVAISYFHDNATTQLPLFGYTTYEDVTYNVDRINYKFRGGKTNTAKALYHARNSIFNSQSKLMLIACKIGHYVMYI